MEGMQVRVVRDSRGLAEQPPAQLSPGDVAIATCDRWVRVIDATVGIVVIVSDGIGTTAVATPNVVRERQRATNRTSFLIDRGLSGLANLRRARAVIIGDRRDALSRVLAERTRSLLLARCVPVVAERMDGSVRCLDVDGFGFVIDHDSRASFSLGALHVPSQHRRTDLLSALLKLS
jgi:hypothetical protein